MKDRKFMFWMISTVVIVGLCAGLGYASYVVLYPPVANWLGHPTIAQQNEFFEFATKVGYRPENELGFNRRVCGGIPRSCSMILIFAVDQPMREINHDDLEIINSNFSTSSSPNLIGAFDNILVDISLDGMTSGLDIPRAPNYPSIGWHVEDISTQTQWTFGSYRTSDYPYPVQIKGSPETRDFVIMSKRFK